MRPEAPDNTRHTESHPGRVPSCDRAPLLPRRGSGSGERKMGDMGVVDGWLGDGDVEGKVPWALMGSQSHV